MKKSFMTIGIVAMLLLVTLPLAAACSSNVCRYLPSGDQAAGSEITVSLDVKVDCATYYAIDECIPAGWTVTSASDGGDYTSDPGYVKWVVASGAVNKTYTYTVCIPNSASGTYSFDGIYQMEEMENSAAIGCDTQVVVTDAGSGGSSSVCRDLPEGSQAAGSSMVVSLDVTPGSATYYAIDESVPAGWTVTGASDGGDYTSISGSVKWVVTSGAVNKTYTYTVCIPDSASGTYSFDGIYQTECMVDSAAISCDTQVAVTDAGSGGSSSVCRDLPEGSQTAGSSMVVSLDVTPGSATYYAIDESVPAGWTVTDASDGGDYTSIPGCVKWVVTSGAVNKTYTYTVCIPDSAIGTYSFDGIYQTECMADSATIGCDTQVAVTDAGSGGSSSVCRDLPEGSQTAGSSMVVSLDVTPGSATYYAIDEVVPAGWTVTGASDGGDYTSIPGCVKWVVTSGAVNKTYTYTVCIPGNISGTYSFDGIYQTECMACSAAIDCDTQVSVVVGSIGPANVCRDLPDVVKAAGSSMVVSLCVTPGSATYYAIDEVVPAGWIVTDASDGGDYISIPGHIKWVVTSGAVNKTYTYTVCIPNNTSGTYSFTGIYQTEYMACSVAIGCDSQVNVAIYSESNNSRCIMLYEGWNFVSVPSKLTDPSFANILSDLPVDAVLDYNAENNTWDSSMNLTWLPLKGYWIHATEDSFIPCERLLKKLPSTPSTLSLFGGWNAIGHCDSTDTLHPELALESIDTLYTHIMGPWDPVTMNYTQYGYNNKTGIIFGKHMGTDVFEMSPYEGYWLYMNEAGVYTPLGY